MAQQYLHVLTTVMYRHAYPLFIAYNVDWIGEFCLFIKVLG
jgi:hypothetical protein